MLIEYLPILVFLGIAVGFACFAVIASPISWASTNLRP